jgi:tetratricopeptide (TPR) repeat protein
VAVPAYAVTPTSESPQSPSELSADEKAKLKAEYDRLFADMLKRPADLDLMFQFAAVAARLGNYEAAISTLERMLLFNRDLPRVKLELGVLYFRIGSYSVARSYLQGALAGRDVPEQVRQKVALYLAQIEKRTSRSHLAGAITFGARYQTNANAGPSSDLIKLFGLDATLNNAFLRQPDWNLFVSGFADHAYDLRWGDGEVWETTLQAYYARQLDHTEVNLGFVEATTGPRFIVLKDEGVNLTFRPFALANVVTLGDESDFHSFGGGFEVRRGFFSDRLALDGGITYRRKIFQDSNTRPTNDLFTSDDLLYALGASYQLNGSTVVSLSGYYNDERARADFNTNQQYSVPNGSSRPPTSSA